VSFAGDDGITYKAVIENLNVLDYDYFFNITDNLLAGNIPETLLLLNEILEHGFDGHHFINGLGEHFRNLLVCTDPSMLKLLEVGENIRDKYGNQSKSCPPDFLLYALDIVAKCDVNYKSANNKRLLIELSLMQMCSITSPNNPFKEVTKAEAIKPVAKITITPAKTILQQPVKKNEEKKNEIKKEEPPTNIVAEPQLKPTAKKIITGTTSILESLAETEKKKSGTENIKAEEAETAYEKPSEIFTKEQFEDAWMALAKTFKQQSPDFYITLTTRMPEVKEDFTIELTIDNVVQEKELIDRKLDILTFLRNKLNNSKLQLLFTLNKNPENIKPFTPQEKFKKMAEKNPAIKKLKDKFDLEIDF
jgi:DNA polymerase-3 subunit gamma/tau